MSDPKKNPTPATITEAGAVELAETELDKVSGGPIYMQVDGIKGNVSNAPLDAVTGKIAPVNNVTIKQHLG